MKDSVKFIKRIVSLSVIILLLFSVMPYAAVVDSSDGKAFVTKEVFENLKKKFDAQLDIYESSLNNKIDGAIANYIKSQVAGYVTSNILNSKYKKVSSINGVFTNEWNMPEMRLLFTFNYYRSTASGGYPDLNNANGFWEKILGTRIYSLVTPDWLTSGTNYRNVVNIEGTPAAPTKIIWKGRAIKFHEKWNIVRSGFAINNTWDLSWLDRPSHATYSLALRNFWRIVQNGQLPISTSLTSLWPFSFLWHYEYWQDSGATGSGDNEANISNLSPIDSLATTITLDTNSEGDATEYDHIISYNKDDEWRLFTTNSNYAYVPNETTLMSGNISSFASSRVSQNALALGKYWAESQGTANNPRYAYFDHGFEEISVSLTDTTSTKYPNLGMIKDKYKSSSIYQDDIDSTVDIANEKIEWKSKTLEAGFQLLAAKVDDIIIWNPEFSYTHVHNGVSTYVDNAHEVDIYFSSTPFTDKLVTTEPIKVQVGEDKTLKDYATTSSRKCKVTFEMPKNGIVYVKWVPHNVSSTYFNSDWIVTLNLENCNNYYYSR